MRQFSKTAHRTRLTKATRRRFTSGGRVVEIQGGNTWPVDAEFLDSFRSWSGAWQWRLFTMFLGMAPTVMLTLNYFPQPDNRSTLSDQRSCFLSCFVTSFTK
ncbi:hypothetical protein R1flu_005589 [Riccia fluitans]|uniref:Uncharacterized protein n=1 Tax=Riccia fluitans TaxID=41844 RepID=A0ABD1YTU8_9MARC